jgi:hypothetical protein
MFQYLNNDFLIGGDRVRAPRIGMEEEEEEGGGGLVRQDEKR